MVEILTNYPKIEGSNPATISQRNISKIRLYIWLCHGSTVVENSAQYPENEGLSPAPCMRREKCQMIGFALVEQRYKLEL